MLKYQFEKIYKIMRKEFGEIKKGHEDPYYQIMVCMEGNALKVNRIDPKANSYRMKEAVLLALWDIYNRISDKKEEINDFRNIENVELEYALLMAFDPFTNKAVKDYADKEIKDFDLHEYYKYPVRALLRICDSIDIWEKQLGSNGYFKMYERDFGRLFPKDDKEMNYAILYPGIPDFLSDHSLK